MALTGGARKKKKPLVRRRKVVAAPAMPDHWPAGFTPALWGNSMWFMIHVIAQTFPDAPSTADKAAYLRFYKSLADVLPCGTCREGYARIIVTRPTVLGPTVMLSRHALFKWTVDVHNRVNAKLGKEVNSDWQAWYKEYDKLRAG